MAEATTLGTWLRRERERRGVSLTDISEQTKLSVPLLQGLEADDLSRWPGGIFRRAFARSYAAAIGVDPDLVVRRIEEEHPTDDPSPLPVVAAPPTVRGNGAQAVATTGTTETHAPRRALVVAAVLDLLVAGAIGFGFAAAGSRLLWPVLAIAAYHAMGVMLTGRSPMLALLLDQATTPARTVEAAPGEQPAVVRTDRTPAALVRAATGHHRQPGRRTRRARGAQGARGG